MIGGHEHIFAEIASAFQRIMPERIHHRTPIPDLVNRLARQTHPFRLDGMR